MAAGTFVMYDVFIDQLGKEGHNLSADTLKCALFNATHAPVAGTDVSFSALANEHSTTTTGYTAGGNALTSVTWTGGILNAANTVWTASTSGIDAKYAVVYNVTTGGINDLVGYVELETGSTVAVTDTNTLTLDFNDSNGIVTIS